MPARVKELPRTSGTVASQGWSSLLVREPFAGAWQTNVSVSVDTALSYSAVYRCLDLISTDISKMRIRLVQLDANGIWVETTSPAFSPVLRKPNRWQNRIQFFSSWVLSKLIEGNTYVLKERDARSVVTELYVLDPCRVKVLVAPDGSLFYELQTDVLSGIQADTLTVPASEIIHDRCGTTFHHPLIGVPPLRAAGAAALQGLTIQTSSTKFFANGGRPSGILTAPTYIDEENVARIKANWEAAYGAGKAGGTAVLGDGLHYEPMAMSAEDSQLLDQLKWGAETVAGVFGVPAYKIGVGSMPTFDNIEALNMEYYSQCLQGHIERIEVCLDEGLSLPSDLTVGFDLDGLFRMDTTSKVKASAEAIKAGFLTPNEARMKFDLKPIAGGDTAYLQVQNYSLAALDARDRAGPAPGSPDAGGGGGGSAPPSSPPPADQGKALAGALAKRLFRSDRAA